MKNILLFSLVLFPSLLASQAVKVSQPAKDVAGIVTVTLSYEAPADDFKPTKCSWYSTRAMLVLIHEGCDSFSREFNEGSHAILLITDGHTSRSPHNEQRSKIAQIEVQPRVAVVNRPYDADEFKPKPKKP